MSEPRIVVRIEQRETARVAWLTIDNPSKLNTLASALLRQFIAAVEELAGDESLCALVVTGGGEKAFVGGADIDEMARLDAVSARAFITLVHQACQALRELPAPVIARINGYALGAGMELAAACDLRVAADTAVFGMPEVKLGIPSVIEAALVPALVGWGRAREILLLGENFSAARAEAWGLVERVVPPGQLDDAVNRWIDALLSAGPRAVRLQKQLIRNWEDLPLSAAIEAGIESFVTAWQGDEPRRLMAEFLAKKRATSEHPDRPRE